MTTIITDGVTIAADGLGCIGGEVNGTDDKKIIIEKGVVYALSGFVGMRDALIAWHQDGAKVADVPATPDGDSWTLLVIDTSGAKYFTGKCAYPNKVRTPFALGSGSDYAMGALHAGLSPQQAVQLVIDKRLDVGTGGEIQVIDIKQALGIKEPGLRAVKG